MIQIIKIRLYNNQEMILKNNNLNINNQKNNIKNNNKPVKYIKNG